MFCSQTSRNADNLSQKQNPRVPHIVFFVCLVFFRLLKLHLKKSEPPSRNLILEGEKAYSRRQPEGKLISQKDLELVRPFNKQTENQKMGRTTP